VDVSAEHVNSKRWFVPPPRALRAAPFSFGAVLRQVLSYPLEPDLPSCLSDVEAAVVLLAQMGLSNADIAQIRAVSQRTVANQLASVYRKLGGVSRSCLLRQTTAPSSVREAP
jgi:DNA-binding CsgD family transcriptional regulator